MPISKRTRFEILRRDAHACRYCGACAPDAALTVDHVTPVALGGTDDPSNLVAACRDCNAGKASTAPDAQLVADVREDAIRHAALIREAYAVLVERMGKRDDYIDTWAESYCDHLPADWRNTIGRWFEMAVPLELIIDAAEKACSKTQRFRGTDRFAYMCGIVWNQVRTVDKAAEDYRAIEGSFMSDSALSDERMKAWLAGWDSGYTRAESDRVRNDPLSVVVDKIDYLIDPWAVAS